MTKNGMVLLLYLWENLKKWSSKEEMRGANQYGGGGYGANKQYGGSGGAVCPSDDQEFHQVIIFFLLLFRGKLQKMIENENTEHKRESFSCVITNNNKFLSSIAVVRASPFQVSKCSC